MKKHVVVTGLGVISSVGIGWEEFWRNLIAGKSGISKITSFDTSPYERHYGGEVKNFDPAKFINPKKIKYMGRASQMAIAAAKLAIKDANVSLKELQGRRTGVCVGTTMGEPQVMEELDLRIFSEGESLKYDARASLMYSTNSLANNVSCEFGLKGPSDLYANACASGNCASSRFLRIQSKAYQNPHRASCPFYFYQTVGIFLSP